MASNSARVSVPSAVVSIPSRSASATMAWMMAVSYTHLPYAVWLCEIMAQQTTLAAVERYWTRFLLLWPTVEALAAADDADVMLSLIHI